MELPKAYRAVDKILNSLDYQSIFSGVHKYRFALYNSEQICIDGKLIPYQDGFIGNTSIPYENGYIAIWNMDFDPIEDTELLAYGLVHEMFHCYQKDNAESRYPSDLILLSYPDDIDNYTKKYSENLYLADAYENHDIEAFKRFHLLRNQRLGKYPDMVLQELRAETLEGLAEYAGLSALRMINAEKLRTVSEDYLKKLRAEDSMIFDIRRISYYSGALYFLCLEIFSDAEKCSFGGATTAYEQNVARFLGADTAEIKECGTISQSYAELVRHRESIVSEHIEKSEFVDCEASICGYDPMNMFRIGNIIYCSHFICLNIGGDVKMLKSAVSLCLKDGTVKEIIGYYI